MASRVKGRWGSGVEGLHGGRSGGTWRSTHGLWLVAAQGYSRMKWQVYPPGFLRR